MAKDQPKPNIRSCHKHPSLVLSYKGLRIYADSKAGVEEVFRQFDLVISLGENLIFSPVMKSEPFRRLLGQWIMPNPEILYLNWPDMSVPSYNREFWIELSRILKKKGNDRARRGRKYKVIVHCFGGHGRTGTALAILSRFIEGREGRLVERIREEYCKNSVETREQVVYVEGITGIIENRVKGTKDFPRDISDYPKETQLAIHRGIRDVSKSNSDRIQHEMEIERLNKKKEPEKNIGDYFKNREKWRKEYTN